MKSVLIALLAVVLCFSANEFTNFTYDAHGRDWKQKNICKGGEHQSPVNLTFTASNIDSYLFTNFIKATPSIYFFNTTIYMNNTIFGYLYTVNLFNKTLSLKGTEVRIRCKSEHQIVDGDNVTKFDLQIQVFHQNIYESSVNDKLALAIFFQAGEGPDDTPDPNLQAIIDAYQAGVSQVSSAPKTISIDFTKYFDLNNNYNYWVYRGSITMPYCTDDTMNWVVIHKAFPMSRAQKQFFEEMFYGRVQKQGNWRDPQPNSNTIGYYRFDSI